MKINCVYLQSGGPTSVINSSLFGVISEAFSHEEIGELYLSHYGILGLINDDLKNAKEVKEQDILMLTNTPGAILGSARHKLKNFNDDTEYLQIINTLKKYNINCLFLNGGNDSMDTGLKLTMFFKKIDFDCKVIGIPKTIDNDLMGTDHTPGFASAAKFVANIMKSLTYDNLSYQKGRVNIVEIMGRDTGWLTLSSGLASIDKCGPDLIYIPEVAFDVDQFLKDVDIIYKHNKRVLVAVSEGIKDKNGNFLYQQNKKDVFSHAQLGGVASYLSSLIENRLNISTRAIELSLLQRCYSGEASQIDINEAIECGKKAVEFALTRSINGMVSMSRTDEEKYSITYQLTPFEIVANKIKYVPISLLNKDKNNINQEYICYLLPLIESNSNPKKKNGLYIYSKKESF